MKTHVPARSPDSVPHHAPVSWQDLLVDAVQTPGRIHAAYHAFHDYSVGNQALAYSQCLGRGLEVGPLAAYKTWLRKGRQVRRGEHALTLCQPQVVGKAPADGERDERHVIFIYPSRWFVFAQTDPIPGAKQEPAPLPPPDWDRERMLTRLEITEIPFTMLGGNTQGYCHPMEKRIAINPVAVLPLKTMIHEAAHCLLHGSKTEGIAVIVDTERLTYSMKEVEAESVTLLVIEALGLEGAEFARGYIQHYLQGLHEIPEPNARRIFTAAEKILSAGRPPKIYERED